MTSLASLGSRGASSSARRLLDDRDPLGQRVGLGREAGVLGGQLAGRGEVGPGLVELGRRLVDRGQLGEAPADPAGRRLVGVDRRVRQPALQLGVLVQQRAQAVGAHRAVPSGPRVDPDTSTAPARPAGRGAPSRKLLALLRLRLHVGVLLLELRHAAQRCRGRAACRCRRGGTRCRSPRGSGRPWRCSACELVAAGTRDGGHVIVRVNVGLHASVLPQWSPGRPHWTRA